MAPPQEAVVAAGNQKRRQCRRKKHTECAVPAGTNFPKESYKGGLAAGEMPRSGKGFNWACAKLSCLRADSRFGKPRIFFGKGFNFVCAKPPLRRAESRFAEPRFSLWEGFNFVSAKPRLRRAELRFAEPRSSLQGNVFWYFLRRAKSTAKTRRGLRPSGLPGTIQSSARYMAFAEMTGHHHVTGRVGNCKVPGYRR